MADVRGMVCILEVRELELSLTARAQWTSKGTLHVKYFLPTNAP